MGSGPSRKAKRNIRASLTEQDRQASNAEDENTCSIALPHETDAKDRPFPAHFLPDPVLSSNQKNCQIVFDSLQPLKKELEKRRHTEHLMRRWKESGVLDRVHNYVDAITKSNPTLEVISGLLTKDSTPYLRGIEKGQSTDLLKAYAIYYWIANNIEYNVNEWNSMISTCSYPDVSPRHVFKKRSSVCSGYANLYELLASQAGLKVTIINGHFKRAISKKGQSDFFNPGNNNSHAWNAVQLGSIWYLIDCTYGAGIIGSSSFTKMYNSLYFAISPKKLILTHWPDSDEWQLLETRLTLQDYRSLIVMTPDSLQLGVHLPACEVLHINRHEIPIAVLSLKVPKHFAVIVTLRPWDCSSSSNDINADNEQYDANIFINSKEDGDCKDVYIAVPKPGNFTCQVFVQDLSSSNPGALTFLTSYLISCEADPPDSIGFPQVLHKVAFSINFQLLCWTGHQDNVKSYMAECTTGQMTLRFKANSNASLSHFISPGAFTAEQIPSTEQCYHFYTSLSQDNNDPSLHILDVVFPLQGLWTICLMLKDDEFEESLSEPVMLYTVNVIGKTSIGTYPWIQSSGLSILHSGTLSTLGNEIFSLIFSVEDEMEFHSVLIGTSSLSSTFHQFTCIEREERGLEDENKEKRNAYYKLMVIFPEPGKWKICVFYRGINSLESTVYSNLFSLFLDVEFCFPNATFPSINKPVSTPLGLSINDSLPLQYNHSVFKTQVSTLLQDKLCFDISLTSLNSPCSSIPIKYYASLFPSEKDGVYNLEAIFPKAGTWAISLSASKVEDELSNMKQVFLFEVLIKEAAILPMHCLYPKLYPAFYSNDARIPAKDIPYQYMIEEKFVTHLIYRRKPNFNIVVYQERCPMNKLSSQALIYPNKDSNDEYIIEAVFPEEGNWIVQLFGDSLTDYDPIIEFFVSVKAPKINLTYPWIHTDFFNVYKMDFHPSGDYLLPEKVRGATGQLSLSIACPDDVHILHQARNQNDVIVDGVTCLLRTKLHNVFCILANFTSPGHWSILLYASRRPSMDNNWDLILQHDVIAC